MLAPAGAAILTGAPVIARSKLAAIVGWRRVAATAKAIACDRHLRFRT